MIGFRERLDEIVIGFECMWVAFNCWCNLMSFPTIEGEYPRVLRVHLYEWLNGDF